MFDVILADPPWFYNKRKNKSKFGLGANQYELMKTKDIKAIDVNKISNKNSLLFLWVTGPRLKEGIAVLEAWGFEFITIAFCWVKSNKKNNKPFFGIGYYTKSNCELVLLGKKGKGLEPKSDSVSQIIDYRENEETSVIEANRQEHSRKPGEVHLAIEKMFPDKSYIELFAREERNNWKALGNHLNGKDIREEIDCLTSES